MAAVDDNAYLFMVQRQYHSIAALMVASSEILYWQLPRGNEKNLRLSAGQDISAQYETVLLPTQL
jgi:hypothetical protein